MTGRIADDAIRQVRERANLAEVVSDVVALKRRGRSAVGLCPFHAEKTPSFTVSEERGFYHCFGCGEHGDVFSFVMKMQSLTFPEAVEAVAARFGIPLPREAVAGGPRSPTAPLLAAHETAAAFYRAMLRGPQGARARAYLAERGIGEASIERFGLGYAPAAGDALAKHLAAEHVREADALAAGLVARRAGGGLYDRFRDRIVFPISDAAGRVCAFGGRILPGAAARPGADAPPKYLNSAESPIFQKGRMLYGLALARGAIRERGRVVVVEGYLDVVSLAQAGIEEVVAPLGTALTADQLRVLRRLAERVIACFDGDAAGRRAAARSFPSFVEAGLWGHGVFLPAGDDPDTFVRTHGGEAFRELLAHPAPLVDAFVRELAGPDREAVGRHAQAAREVVRVLQRVADPLEREPLIRLAAEYLGVREQTLREQGAPAAAAPAPARPAAAAVPRGELRAEFLIVELLAVDPTVASHVAAEGIVREFEDDACREAAERLLGAADDDARRDVIEALPASLRDRIVQRVLHEDSEEDRARMVADCIARIRSHRHRRRSRELRAELHAAEVRGDLRTATAIRDELNRHLTEKDPR